MTNVLIVDDDPKLLKMLQRTLIYEGFRVRSATNGNEALAEIQAHRPEVVVLDWLMPGMDGLGVLAHLREAGDKTLVLMLTARDAVENRVEGLESGADDYLVKPFAFEELLARVRALARRAYRAKNPIIKIGNLHLESTTQRVWLGQKEVNLTPREYALLEYLTMRAGEVVSRTDIWEHVYEFHSEADSNVVDVYIGYLRKKLDTSGKPSLIQTVRGRGYSVGVTP
jgi:two-component system response regulator MprA